MKIIKIIFISILLFIPFNNCFGGDAGTSSIIFLKSDVGARPISMGGAFCSIADDANSIYWNPAGLMNIDKNEFTFMHSEWLMGSMNEYGAFVHSFSDKYAIGLSLNYLRIDDLVRRDEYGDEGDEIDLFGFHDEIITISNSFQVFQAVSLGINIKYINECIDVYNATAYSGDIGLLLNHDTYGLGLVFQNLNIGKSVKHIEEGKEFPLPMNIKVGFCYKGVKNFLLASDFDVEILNDYKLRLHLGAEYRLNNIMAIRIGYKDNSQDLLAKLSVGIGFKYNDVGIDYGVLPFEDLGWAHKVSMRIMFGRINKTDMPKEIPSDKLEEVESNIEIKKEIIVEKENLRTFDENKIESSNKDTAPEEAETEINDKDVYKTASIPQGIETINKPEEPEKTWTIYYVFGSTEITDIKDYDTLNEITKFIRANNNFKLKINSYTDNKEDGNIEMGNKRIDSVLRYLISRKKLPGEIFETESFGSANPKGDNSTEEGRSKNRRVDILLFNIGTSNKFKNGIKEINEEERKKEVISQAPGMTILKNGINSIEKSWTICYDVGKSIITNQSDFDSLINIVKIIRKNPNSTIGIYGHSDSKGDKIENERMAKERANNIYKYFTSNIKLSKEIFTVKSYGAEKPIASNETEEGRSQNRRVEIIVLNE